MDIKGTCISSTRDEHGPIYVYQTRTSRILSFDGKIYQSCMKLKNINRLDLDYTQAMMAGLFFVPTAKTATVMGLGAGSMVKSLLNSFSELSVHAVEFRQAVVNTAKEYFHLPDTERLSIHIDDAVNYINKTELKSDIIFSDLFSSEGMEPKQVQLSFLSDCNNALNDQGVLVLNVWHTTPKRQQDLDEVLTQVFGNRILRLKVKSGNIIILAFKNDIPLIDRKVLFIQGQWLQNKMNIPMSRYAELLCDSQDL